MQKNTRAVFHEEMQPGKENFRLHVLGYCFERNYIVDVPEGTSCWFFNHFHTPVSLHTLNGISQTRAHTFCINAPGERLYHGRNGKWEHSWVRLSGKAIAALLAHNGLQTAHAYELEEEEESLRWLQGIYEIMNHPHGPDEEGVERLMQLWLGRVKFLSAQQQAPIKPSPVLEAMRYVQSHFREDISLSELSHVANLSISQLCRQFRRHLHTSPQAYILRCRMAQANELLSTTSLSIGEIAHECGFSDVYYFSRMFKKHEGCPPSKKRSEG